ncbi:replication endonuclease [Aeromonas hydrophila]|uniref:replication endonuclease n=1 Tax=Aeromonas hydrophila TaxID=644 RepID=UPI003EC87F09
MNIAQNQQVPLPEWFNKAQAKRAAKCAPREIQPNFAPVTSTAWNSIANLRRCQPFSPETVADKFAALPIGTASCAIFREKIALRHPALIGWFTHVYQSRNALLGLQAANAAIRTIDQRLSISGELGVLRFSGDDQFVDTFAQRFADHTGKLVSTRAHVVALQLVVELAHHYGLRPVDTITEEQALDPYPTLNRWADMAWVRCRIRRVSASRLYDTAREYSLISGRLAPYTTDLSVARRAFRRARNDETLAALVAHNSEDVFDAVGMKDAVDASVSNLKNRRAELMARLSGFSKCAKEQGHHAIFLTFTTPSRFHSVHRNGNQNQNWLEAGKPSVRDAQQWLVKTFNNIRKKADKEGIKPYGFRFAEPHHDGTPHWHAVLFMTLADIKTYIKICRHYMLADSGNEPGARQHRFKVVFIDRARVTLWRTAPSTWPRTSTALRLAMTTKPVNVPSPLKPLPAWMHGNLITEFDSSSSSAARPYRHGASFAVFVNPLNRITRCFKTSPPSSISRSRTSVWPPTPGTGKPSAAPWAVCRFVAMTRPCGSPTASPKPCRCSVMKTASSSTSRVAAPSSATWHPTAPWG